MTSRSKKVLPVVVVDTREQQPYTFDPKRVVTVRRALKAGDYSLDGFEDRIAIERKSLDDFVGTVIRAQGRFELELGALAQMEFAAVVVEASHDDVVAHRYRMGVHPNAVLGSAVAITIDHGVPVFFCTNRQHACQFVEGLLCRFHRKVTQPPNSGASSTPSATPLPASRLGP
jgi:ERCC4-type nuclease